MHKASSRRSERSQIAGVRLVAAREAKDKAEADLLSRERTFAEQLSRSQADVHLAFEELSRLSTELTFACSAIAEMRRSGWWRFTHPFSQWGILYEEGVGGHLNLSMAPQVLVNHRLRFAAEELPNKPDRRQSKTLNQSLDGEVMTLSELLSKPQESFIRSAYIAILGREADRAGVEHYSSMLMSGKSRASVLLCLYDSKEAKATLGPYRDLASLDDAVFLDAIYLRLLGRSPDPEGRRHYLAELQNPSGRRRVIRDIELSAEASKINPHRAAFSRQLEEMLRIEQKSHGWRGWFLPTRRLEARLNQTHEIVVSLSAQLASLHASLSHGLSKIASAQVSVVTEGRAGDRQEEEVLAIYENSRSPSCDSAAFCCEWRVITFGGKVHPWRYVGGWTLLREKGRSTCCGIKHGNGRRCGALSTQGLVKALREKGCDVELVCVTVDESSFEAHSAGLQGLLGA